MTTVTVSSGGGVVLKDPSETLRLVFDWSGYCALTSPAASLISVTYTTGESPEPLTIDTATINSQAKSSSILVAGGAHGETYCVEAVGTLSWGESPINGEIVSCKVTIRCVNS